MATLDKKCIYKQFRDLEEILGAESLLDNIFCKLSSAVMDDLICSIITDYDLDFEDEED